MQQLDDIAKKLHIMYPRHMQAGMLCKSKVICMSLHTVDGEEGGNSPLRLALFANLPQH